MKHYFVRAISLFLLTLVSVNSQVLADPPVYENFKGKVLNSGRWLGGRIDIGAVDSRRKIRTKDNAIHMRIRGIADDVLTTGERQKVINRIWVSADRSPAVRSLQTYVKVNEALVEGCLLPGAADSQSAYQNHGVWFNSGESLGAEDRLGDVYTTIGLRKSSANATDDNTLDITAYVGRCADSNCDTSSNYFNEVIGTYTMGSNIVLRTTWDEVAKEFRFYTRPKGQDSSTVSFYYAGSVADGNIPGTPVRRTHGVQVRSDAADCDMSSASNDYPFGLLDAWIYNVRISDSPDGL